MKDLKIINFDNLKGLEKGQTYRNGHSLLPQHPYSMLITSKSGGGKSVILCNLLTKFSPFDRIYLITPHLEQSKYKLLQKFYDKILAKTGEEILFTARTIEEAPTSEDLEDTDELQTCICFDDVIMEKDLQPIERWFVKNRHSNTSVIFLSQVYTNKIPKSIRLNAMYHIFLKCPNKKELSLIYQELGYNTTKDKFIDMFNKATNGYNFFLVDLKTQEPLLQYRKNFDEVVV